MVKVVNHPLISHKMTIIRDKNTPTKDFHQTVTEIGSLMTYEITKDLLVKEIEIETPICKTFQPTISQRIVIVPILRAGLGMVDGVRNMIPTARIGHIGMYRDETTALPVPYYCKLPSDIEEREVIVLDPMLATGGSAIDAIAQIKEYNPKSIKFMGIIAAPEGLQALTEAHPDVDVYCAALDEKLNEHKYIVPGLGDAGDRIFGTK